MRLCKVCECGKILYYMRGEDCPDPCPECGRMTLGYDVFAEDDPKVEIKRRENLEKLGVKLQAPTAEEAPAGNVAPSGFQAPPSFQAPGGSTVHPGFKAPTGNLTPPPSFQAPTGNAAPPTFQTPNSNPSGTESGPSWKQMISAEKKTKTVYRLHSLQRGYYIELPETECIVGRTEIGGEQLAHNNAVSRKHIKVQINKRQKGIIVTDISHYGTKINGIAIIKDKPVLLSVGGRITLYNEDLILETVEV